MFYVPSTPSRVQAEVKKKKTCTHTCLFLVYVIFSVFMVVPSPSLAMYYNCYLCSYVYFFFQFTYFLCSWEFNPRRPPRFTAVICHTRFFVYVFSLCSYMLLFVKFTVFLCSCLTFSLYIISLWPFVCCLKFKTFSMF